MLEKYHDFLEKCKNQHKSNKQEMMDLDLEKIQNIFAMQDTNKELQFYAINQKQINMTLRYEEHIQTLLENIYFPDYNKLKESVNNLQTAN